MPDEVPRRIGLAGDLVLCGYAAIFLAVSVLGYSVIDDSLTWGVVVLLAGCAAAIGTVSLFLLSSAVRASLALVFLSVTGGLVIGNFLLMFRDPYTSGNLSLLFRDDFDWRDKYEVVQALRDTNPQVYPAIFPSILLSEIRHPDQLLPLGGISNVMTVYCNESGTYTVFQADRYGFNNEDSIYDGDRPRVVLIGDSYAQGACVEPGEDVAAILRHYGLAAITLGNDDRGPMVELATLKEYGTALEPKVVVWMYYNGNDLQNLRSERKNPILQKYFEGHHFQNLTERQKEIDELLIAFALQEEEKERRQRQVANSSQKDI